MSVYKLSIALAAYAKATGKSWCETGILTTSSKDIRWRHEAFDNIMSQRSSLENHIKTRPYSQDVCVFHYLNSVDKVTGYGAEADLELMDSLLPTALINYKEDDNCHLFGDVEDGVVFITQITYVNVGNHLPILRADIIVMRNNERTAKLATTLTKAVQQDIFFTGE